jgi:hypothetical protein
MGVMAIVLSVFAAAGGVPQYFRRFRGRSHRVLYTTALAQLVLLGTAALIAAVAVATGTLQPVSLPLAAAFSVAAAALGGGPVTVAILRLSQREDHPLGEELEPEEQPRPVLQGGAWIGVLERTAIAATLWASWPEGLAVVLAVKGLGRYSELGQEGAAERFILGTFSSVLWACACTGVGLMVRG